MKKHYNILLGTTLCSTVLLSGCVSGAAADKTENSKQVKAVAENKNTAETKDIALAKFMYETPNDAKAFELFLKYAEQGNAEAEAWVARCYMNGVGTPKDYVKAFQYFSKAAAKNHPCGINGLGVCKQYGYGTSVDLRAAIDYFKKAADMGFPLATLNLAKSYSDKKGGFYDEKLAEEYLKKAVSIKAQGANERYANFLINRKRYSEALPLLQDAKDFYSMMQLAQCYENGWGVAVDIKKSLSIMEAAYRLPDKEQWSANSFYTAGMEELLINGNTDFARHCFKVGAEQGDRESLYIHALSLKDSGQIDQAIKYLERAADMGYDLAQLELGKVLRNKKYNIDAIKYLTMATLSDRTKKRAVELLAAIYYDIGDVKQCNHWSMFGKSLGIDICRNHLAHEKFKTGTDENIALAAAWYAISNINDPKTAGMGFADIIQKDYNRLRVLADKGNGNALFALGIFGCLEEKHPNVPIGLELLEKAAKQNNVYACNTLGNIYRIGKLGPKDLKKALSYYRQGAELNDESCARWAAMMLFYEKEFEKTPLDEIQKAFEKCLELGDFSLLNEYARVMQYVAKDMKQAEELYRLSAATGDTRSMVYLYHYLSKKDPAASNDYLWQAIERGDSFAELMLGNLESLRNNNRIAYSWYLKSYLDGDHRSEAAARLAECWLYGRGCEQNIKMFWKFAEMAYKNGSPTACLILGDVYREGKICPRDINKTKAYFAEGAKRGDKSCQIELSKLR